VSESNVPLSLGVRFSRQLMSLILLSLEVMPRVLTILHLLVAYIDDITRQ